MKFFKNAKVRRLLLAIVICYAIILVFAAQFQRSFIYFPGNTRIAPAEAGAKGMEVIAVQPKRANFAIEGWYQAPSDPKKPVIVYFHGNAMTIPYAYARIEDFLRAGYGVLLAEYRGYNGNPGKPTERGLYADADAYIDWLKDKAEIPEERIVLYGASLGTGVAVEQASKRWNIAAVILESPYTSLVDLARRYYFFLPVDLLLADRYPSRKRIEKIDRPLLILHGEMDTVIPAQQGKALFAAANKPKTLKLYPQGGHNDLPARGAIDDILAFLKTLDEEGSL